MTLSLSHSARALVAGAAVLTIGALSARDARACGGCFIPPKESTVVSDHRMAFAISKTQSVLWDQIRYQGNPAEFVWVLPVLPGTKIELSHDEWIAALDASTQPIIQGPTPTGGGGGCGVGCGASTSAADSLGAPGGSVQVVSQQVVGPYETVTLRSTDPKALENWLLQHGYDIPPSIQPTIDAYVSEGFDFLALRLQPGKGVNAMQPVRVVTSGADPSLPLRMVAAGAGASVGLTLYVIGEGRWEASSFPNAKVDDSQLVWDTATARSNYQELVQSLMASNGGRTWVTESAQHAQVLASPYGYASYGGNPGLADAYFSKCSGHPAATFQALDAGGADAAGDASDGDAASDAGENDASASDAGGNDAGASDGGASCGSTCCDFDDLNVAMRGLDSSTVWVTRMRAALRPDQLAAGDLVLRASATQDPVSNVHFASAAGSKAAGVAPQSPAGSVATVLAALGATASVLRRRKKR